MITVWSKFIIFGWKPLKSSEESLKIKTKPERVRIIKERFIMIKVRKNGNRNSTLPTKTFGYILTQIDKMKKAQPEKTIEVYCTHIRKYFIKGDRIETPAQYGCESRLATIADIKDCCLTFNRCELYYA